MSKKFIPAGIEVKRHLDAFAHVGCISRVFKNAGIDPHRTKGKEHRVYSQDGKTYWLLFDVLCHGFLTEYNINGRYLRAVLERPSLNRYFSFGFGSFHMWVCEPGSKFRLIFVEF